MGAIILIVIGLWGLWAIGRWSFEKIRNYIEDFAIRKSRIKEDTEFAAQGACRRLDPYVQQAKADVATFRELAFESLPGLQGRIERHQRQQDYVHFVLPYKKKSSKKRRR